MERHECRKGGREEEREEARKGGTEGDKERRGGGRKEETGKKEGRGDGESETHTNFDPFLLPYTNISSKWTIDLNR